ncbi:MAG: MFS transporter [Hasllibacter sp.]
MRLILSFAALFATVALLQLSSGGIGPLDALAGLSLGFTRGEVGLLGSAHFLGFFIGCWWAPRLMGSVGHSRAFAACTAAGAIGIMGHVLVTDPLAWSAFRVLSGLCVAGCYTVIESWLQAKTDNASRGRTMGIYRAVDLGASLGSQLIVGVLAPLELYVAYTLLAMLCTASLLPLTLSTRRQPALPKAPRLRPMAAVRNSPLAVAAVIASGLTAASFRMVGPIYGAETGLTPAQVGLFLAAWVAGGAAGQIPAGWLADRHDRRTVLIALSALALSACALLPMASGTGPVMAAAFWFGLTTFPIYSVAAAHAHDFVDPEGRVELSANLLFHFAVGAIAAPVAAARLIDAFGPPALFGLIAAAHVLLIAFALLRRRARPALARTPYVYKPRTSPFIGRLLRRQRDRGLARPKDDG